MKKFILLFFVNLIIHLPFISKPPCGVHVWRQCNTLAMAKNFATESMNIFEPKIDRRDGTNGITGSHFPLYEWLLAVFYKVFGFYDIVPRMFSLLLFTLALLAFQKVLEILMFSPFLSTIGALLLLSIPEFYYHAINAMPDILALAMALWGLYFWLKLKNKHNNLNYLIAFILTIICGLIKIQFLIIPFAALAFLIQNKKQWLKIIILWFLIVLITFLWYRYAIKLTQLQNLKEYGLWIQPISIKEKLNTFWLNISMDLPEILLGWPLFIAFVCSIFYNIYNRKNTPLFWFSFLWFLGFLAFYIVAIERMKNHSYYFMALLPLLVIFILLFLQQKSIKKWIIYSLLILNFTWAFVRIIPSRWVENKAQIPKEFYHNELRKQFENTIPKGEQVLIGPDISGCIYFYFTNTKGFAFTEPSELFLYHNGEQKLASIKKLNVKYIIFKNEPLMQPYLDKLGLKHKLKQVGDFQIWTF